MIPIDKIENTETCFIQLWLQLDITREELIQQYKRFTISNILKSWLGPKANDDFIWTVCIRSEQYGLNELPHPMDNPAPNREFLRAFVSVVCKIRMRHVDVNALDKAYRIAYPK